MTIEEMKTEVLDKMTIKVMATEVLDMVTIKVMTETVMLDSKEVLDVTTMTKPRSGW